MRYISVGDMSQAVRYCQDPKFRAREILRKLSPGQIEYMASNADGIAIIQALIITLLVFVIEGWSIKLSFWLELLMFGVDYLVILAPSLALGRYFCKRRKEKIMFDLGENLELRRGGIEKTQIIQNVLRVTIKVDGFEARGHYDINLKTEPLASLTWRQGGEIPVFIGDNKLANEPIALAFPLPEGSVARFKAEAGLLDTSDIERQREAAIAYLNDTYVNDLCKRDMLDKGMKELCEAPSIPAIHDALLFLFKGEALPRELPVPTPQRKDSLFSKVFNL